MKTTVLLILLLTFTLKSLATDYYVSTNPGANDLNSGTSTASPWRTLGKINSFSFSSGDQIFFNRGNTWFGQLKPISNNITIGAYGTGDYPVISGFTVMTGWVGVAGRPNVWEANCNSAGEFNGTANTDVLSMVVKNDVVKHAGRFPNLTPEGVNNMPANWRKYNGANASRGYLDYESISGTNLRDDELSNANPTNISYAGGELAVRTSSWRLERKGLSSNSGDNITMTGSLIDTRATKGYFIQRHTNTLDEQDEWYYNASTHKLQVYSTSNPNTAVWKAATVTDVVYLVGRSGITIQDLRIEGGDTRGLRVDNTTNLTIKRCNIRFCGNEVTIHTGAIACQYQTACNGLTVEDNIINDCHSPAVGIRQESPNLTIRRNLIKNIGVIPGAGDWQNEGYAGISAYATNALVEYNRIDSTGWSGTNIHSLTQTLRFNVISNFCLIKDDGGGIYTSNQLGAGTRFWYKNIVYNGGSPYGGKDLHWDIPNSVQGQTRGMYIDEVSDGFLVTGNTVYNINGEGMYIHLGKNHVVRENMFLNCEEVAIVNDNNIGKAGASSGLTAKANVFATTNPLSKLFLHYDDPDNMGTVWTLDSNWYVTPFAGPAGQIERTVEVWPPYTGYAETWKSLPSLRQHYPAYEPHAWESPVNYKQYTTVSALSGNMSNSFSVVAGTGTQEVGTTGEFTPGNWYRIRFRATGTGTQSNYDGVVTLTAANSSQPELIDRMYTGNNQGFRIKSGTPYNVDWIFQVNRNSGANAAKIEIQRPSSVAIDSLRVERVSVTFPNVTDSVRLVWNTSLTDSVISIPGTWKELKSGSNFNNSITVPSFQSRLLLKVPNSGNTAPISVAGADQTITLPTNFVTVNGSASVDAEGPISTYLWGKISGPVGGTITSPSSATTTITGLNTAGTYVYRLTVFDAGGLSDTDDMTITVNPAPGNVPPTVSAGLDKTVNLPTNTVLLNGSASDVDGTVTVLWTRISGPNTPTYAPTATSASVTLGNLIAGTYVMKLTATDDDGATANDTVNVVVVANSLPVALAGADELIQLPANSVVLTGSESDADGTVTARQWTVVSGPSVPTITPAGGNALSVTVSNMIQGIYVMRFTVTDDDGGQGFDEMEINVSSENIPPSANAGPNVTLRLPTNSTTVTGVSSDLDGTVVSRLWTKVSGPSSFTINTPTANSTLIYNLVEGTYVFRYTPTDDDGGTNSDDMTITVEPSRPKITALYKEYTYDLRGSEGEGGANPYGLVNGGYDPKNGTTSLGTILDDANLHTSIHPYTKAYQYNSNEYGSQIDFDLKVNYTLNEIWWYDWGFNADSMYIMAGDWNTGWDTLVAYKTTGVTEEWGWKSASFNDIVTKKVRVTFINSDLDLNHALGEVSEMVLYGTPIGTPPTQPATAYTGERQPTPSVHDFLYVNTFKEIDSLKWWKPFGGVRIYKHIPWYDTAQTNTFPIKTYRENIFNSPQRTQMRYYSDTLKDLGKNVYISYKEAPQYIMTEVAPSTDGRRFRTDNYPTDDPRSLTSYDTDSMFFNVRTKLYGGVVHDTNNIPITDVPKFSGIGTMDEVQIGNEEVSAWSNIEMWDPVIAAAHTVKVTGGIKAADPNTRVIMSPYTKPDTNALKVQMYALEMLGDTSRTYYDGGIAYHQYIFRGQNEFPATNVYDTGATALHGELPEKFGLLSRLTKIRNATYKYAGNVPLFIDEFNWSRNPANPFNVPLLSGMDAATSQGVLIVKALNYGIHAGIDRMAVYWMVNDVADGSGGIFDAMGLMDAPGPSFQEVPKDSYFWVATFGNVLGNYKPLDYDTSGAVWIFRYQNINHADSIAYFIAKKDTGAATIDYPLDVGSVIGNAKVITFNDVSDVGVTNTQTVTSGDVTIASIDYVPQIVIVKQGVVGNTPPNISLPVDRTITADAIYTTIFATASDPDGTIASYMWDKVSGPAQYHIDNPTASFITFSNFVVGTYVIRCTVLDDDGAADFDEITITINPAPVNQPPVADAGDVQIITLPTSTAFLNGGASYDPEGGALVSYQWTYLSGPVGATIVQPLNVSTNITGLVEGTYVFRLRVLDSSILMDTDDVTVIVLPVPAAGATNSFKVRGLKKIIKDVNE